MNASKILRKWTGSVLLTFDNGFVFRFWVSLLLASAASASHPVHSGLNLNR
jgi:hypothetical protein